LISAKEGSKLRVAVASIIQASWSVRCGTLNQGVGTSKFRISLARTWRGLTLGKGWAKDIMSRDNETWLAHLKGDSTEQQAALSDLRAALIRGLRGALSGRALADDSFLQDVVQDSLLRILDRLPQFEGRSQFLTWATCVAIRVAMSELRRRQWKDVSFDDVVGDASFKSDRSVDNDLEPEARLEQKAMVEKMFDVIENELPEKQRAALLAELKEMPQDEIARHIGSNRNAVYKLTHDARKRLKRSLQAAGYEAADIREAFTR